MDKMYASALVWFRRDLRATDHAALYQALKAARAVHCAFVFDTAILDPLPRRDRRVEFIRDAVETLDRDLGALAGRAGGLLTVHGAAADELPRLAARLGVQAVFANHDYEAQAVERDARVRDRLGALGIALHTFKDQVVFERDELLTQAGKPYSVFTPYSRAWLAKLDPFYLKAYAVERHAGALRHRWNSRAPFRRWPSSASSPREASAWLPARRPPRRCCDRSSSGSRITTGCATCRRRMPPAASACTCASAPSRSVSWPRGRGNRPAPAPRPG
jgi:deoxyribodipyrimidine photolyase